MQVKCESDLYVFGIFIVVLNFDVNACFQAVNMSGRAWTFDIVQFKYLQIYEYSRFPKRLL